MDATDSSVPAFGASWLAAGRRSAPDRAGCGWSQRRWIRARFASVRINSWWTAGAAEVIAAVIRPQKSQQPEL
jgi:hypothetical protein